MVALLRRRTFAAVWFGGLISLTGDWVLRVGLLIFVYQLSGSTLATGTTAMASMLPRLLFGSVAGVFVDRWDRQRTLVIANLLLALGLLPLLLVDSVERLWLVWLVAFVQATLAQVVQPAEGALLPTLVEAAELVSANALTALNGHLARLAGPAIGGGLFAVLGLTGAVWVDAASFLAAALLIGSIRRPPAAAPPADAPPDPTERRPSWLGVWSEWCAGLALIRRGPVLRVLFTCIAITSIGEGVMSAVFVPFVTRVVGGGSVEYGWILSAQAVGGILGSVAMARVAGALPPARWLGIGGILFGLLDLAIFYAPLVVPGVTPVLILMVLVGLPGAAMMVTLVSLLQQSTEDAYRGRVLGAFGATSAIAALLGSALGGSLGDHVGIVQMLTVQGAGYMLAGWLVLARLPVEQRPPGEPAQGLAATSGPVLQSRRAG